MVYLDNTTSAQTVWIPRNDGNGSVHTGSTKYELEGVNVSISADTTVVRQSSGYYGMSAVTVDASEYAQENYDNGFDDGFNDGYASGATDGYDEGVEAEKAKLSATTFTANTAVTLSDGGYSAVTINVPQTGTSLNIEANKPYTATTNGSYSIKPSVYTTVNDSFENGVYRITFEHSGYPTNEVISVLRVEDFSDPTKGYVDISIVRGQSSYYIGLWSGGTVYRESLTPLTLRFENANEHYGWVKDVGYIENYDAMSAVSLNVNVPMPNIEQNKSFTATSNGNYTITPSSYSVVDVYGGTGSFYIKTKGYTDNTYIGYFRNKFMYVYGKISIYWSNSSLSADTRSWSGDTIEDIDIDIDSQGNDVLEITLDGGTYEWVGDGDTGTTYDAMSAVSLTVDVECSRVITPVEWIKTTESSMTSYLYTNIIPTSATTFRVKGQSLGINQSNVIVGSTDRWDWEDYRLFWYTPQSNGSLYFDYNYSRLNSTGNTFLLNGGLVDLTCGNNYVYDNISNRCLLSGNTVSQDPLCCKPMRIDVGSWKVSSIEIWQGQTKVFDGRASYDNLGNIGLYDLINETMLYDSGFSMTYGNVLPSFDYQSGYTEGHKDAYIDFIERTATSIVIPSGCTKIASYAFYYNGSITSVTIPYGVLTIGADSFEQTGLKSVDIPDSVTTISDWAFYGCLGLVTVRIGRGVTSIGSRVFRNCSSITDIYVSAINQPTITSNTFQGVNSTGTVHYPAGSDYSSWQNDQYLSGWTFVGDL